MQALEERLSREYMTLEDYAETVDRSLTDIRGEQTPDGTRYRSPFAGDAGSGPPRRDHGHR